MRYVCYFTNANGPMLVGRGEKTEAGIFTQCDPDFKESLVLGIKLLSSSGENSITFGKTFEVRKAN